MKCSVCGKKIEDTFLGKIVGSYVKKTGSNKKYPVCSACQKTYTKEELLTKIS